MVRRRTHGLVVGALAFSTVGTLGAGTGAAQAAAPPDLFHPYVATDPTAGAADAASVAIGDVTGDGRADIVMTTGYAGPTGAGAYSLWVYRQQPGGGLDAPVQVRTGVPYGSTMSLALADLDGDGDLDAAVTTTVGVLTFRQVAGSLVQGPTIDVPGGRDLAAGDLDADGLSDLAVNTDDGLVVVKQTPGASAPYATARLSTVKSVEVEVGDVTGDGRADVVTGDYQAVKVYAQTPGGFASPVSYATGAPDPTWNTVNGIAIGDTDGDGRADVHVSLGGNRPNSWVATLPQLPDGTLGTPRVRASYDIPGAMEVADVTGDGRSDLVVVHDGWNAVGVHDSTPGTDPSETRYPVPYASSYDAKALAIGDISGDGRADVALADYNNGLVLLRSASSGVDVTAPQTTITSAPPSTLRSRTASLSFTSDEPATFTCRLDSGAWTPCTSPTTYTGLSSGGHDIAVRATDLALNDDPSPATAFFSVDGPDTSITSGPTAPIRASTATFTFASQPVAASYECGLDGYDWHPCSSPTTITGLAPGSAHAFYVRGVSADGLPDLSPAQRLVYVDPQADLGVTTTAAPATVKKGTQLTWTSQVRDVGPGTSAGITFTQTVPAGLTSVSASVGSSTTLCGVSAGTVRCSVPDLAAGATATVTVKATVTVPNGSLTSTARVTTTSWDPSSGNDAATSTVKVGNGK